MAAMCCCIEDSIISNHSQRSEAEVRALHFEDHSIALATILEEAPQSESCARNEPNFMSASRLSPLARMQLRPVALGPERVAVLKSVFQSSDVAADSELELCMDDVETKCAATGAIDLQNDSVNPSIVRATDVELLLEKDDIKVPISDVRYADCQSFGDTAPKDVGLPDTPTFGGRQTDDCEIAESDVLQVDAVIEQEGVVVGPEGAYFQRCLHFFLSSVARSAMFTAWWLGARRFHRPSEFDSEPDVDNVSFFLGSPSAALSAHFTRVSPSGPRNGSVLEWSSSPTISSQVQSPTESRDGRMLERPSSSASSQQARQPITPKSPTESIAVVPGPNLAGKVLRVIDQRVGNGDGELDASDLFESSVEERQEVEEEYIKERFYTGQARPVFVAFETLATLGLWFVFASKQAVEGSHGFFTAEAGLGTLLEGSLDLRIHRDCVDLRHQVWRWFAYQFTHIGFAHACINATFIVLLGVPLEGLHGSVRVAAMYNCGVFGGACGFFVFSAHQTVVGSSGGCYAFLGMHVADLAMNWRSKHFRKPTAVILVALAVADFAHALSQGPAVNHATHVGGLVAGLCIGVVFGHNCFVEDWENFARKFFSTLAFGLACFSVAWLAAAWPPRSLGQQLGWCWMRQVFNRTLLGDRWECIRCGSADCMATWGPPNQQNVALVDAETCDKLGWGFIDGA